MSLCELLNIYGNINTHYGTDKNTSHSYGQIYEYLFSAYKYKAQSILEIGFDSGASLQVYSEYFVNATIYGIDIEDNCLTNIKTNNRIHMVFGDATDISIINHFDKMYDIIIEDGSHTLNHQICHFKDYSDFVLPDGCYIIEDVHEVNMSALKLELEPLAISKGFSLEIVDLRNIKNRFDDILFIFKKK